MSANTTAIGINDVADILGRQLSQLNVMLDILTREHDALQSNNLGNFEKVIQEKYLQTRKMESLESELESLKHLLGGKLLKENMLKFLEQTPSSNLKARLASLWDDFQNVLQKCNTQNKTNNRVIEASRSQLQQALSILRGESITSNLYGATGKHDSSPQRNQSIAVA